MSPDGSTNTSHAPRLGVSRFGSKLAALSSALCLLWATATATAAGPTLRSKASPSGLIEPHAETQRRTVPVTQIQTARITLDGSGDESEWQRARPASKFTQSYPTEGAAPSQDTRVRVLAAPEGLYFLLEAKEEDSREIRGLLTQRDVESPSDWLEVWLDPQNDGRTGYRFAVNAMGVQLDARLSQGGEVEDINWHAVWESSTALGNDGWTAELLIPYSELRYEQHTSEWSFQIVRRIARTNETSMLGPVPKAAARPLLHTARLTGLPSLPTSGGWVLRPYGLLRTTLDGTGLSWEPNLGGDIRWNAAAATTWQLTLFPDFGQVEQDPSQLNLGAFEIRQQERRQFFLDGAENLRLPLAYANFADEQLYYSRRVGAAPSFDLDMDSDDVLFYPSQTRIVAASKLLGRTEAGLSYSMLNAVTDREHATVRTASGGARRVAVASPTSFNVARLRQEVQEGRGQVGATATYVHRFTAGELAEQEVESALVAGPDFDLRWGRVGLKGQLLGSRLDGTAAAIDTRARASTNNLQRPDTHHLNYSPGNTSLSGAGLALLGGVFDGSPWRGHWGGHLRSPGFNANDLGFMQGSDQQKWEVRLQRRFDEPSALHLFGEVQGGAWLTKTWGPELTGLAAWLDNSWHLSNNWWVWAGMDRSREAWNVRLLRGGPAFLVPGKTGAWLGVHTDQRRAWDLKANVSGTWGDEESERRLKTELTLNFRPTSFWSFSLGPTAESRLYDLQYVDTRSGAGRDEYVLGRLQQLTYFLTLRSSLAIALGLTLNVYASPFQSVGQYKQFYLSRLPGAQRYGDRRVATRYDGDSSFRESQLRANVVLRWDYAPGAFAYLAWTHNQSASEDTRADVLAPGLAALWRAPATDILMAKVNYFFGL